MSAATGLFSDTVAIAIAVVGLGAGLAAFLSRRRSAPPSSAKHGIPLPDSFATGPVAEGPVFIEEPRELAPDRPPPPIPGALADALVHGSAILMIGSSPAVRVNAPSWKQFLGDLASEAAAVEDADESGRRTSGRLDRLLRRNEVDSVVDLIEDMIGRDGLAISAEDAFRGAQPSPGLRSLCMLPWAGFVSTGIDGSARSATSASRVVTARSIADFEQFVRAQERFLLELSGDLAQPGTLSLTQAQLKETISSAPDLRSLLTTILSSRTVLFVGMSFAEIEFLLDAVGIFGQTSTTHFALIEDDPDFELIADRARSRYSIELLDLPGAAALPDFSDRLKQATEQRATALGPNAAEEAASGSYISRVKLTNIGPFSEASVELQPGWTVILGNNGAGKSTLLEAIALVLAGTDDSAKRFARSLLKRGQKSGSIELTVEMRPQPSTYRAQLSLEGDRVNLAASVSPLQSGSLAAFAFAAVRGVTLPMMMQPQSLQPQPLPRVSDVLPLLEAGPDTRSQELRLWIRQNYAVQQDQAVPPAQRARARAKIDRFFAIVDEMAPGFDLRFSRCDSLTGEILLETSDGEIPLDYVSQGMSSMIGWLGTLIQRLFDINDDQPDPCAARAILLIDEIDSHLHPEWQQRLVPALRQHFPNLQVIATTHSAIMVGSLEEQEVVKVQRDAAGIHIERLDKSYKGYRFDQILTDEAFDLASARDQDWEALRREYASLLGKSDRTSAEEVRYLELDEIMDSAPPPFEERSDREAYEASRERVDQVIASEAVRGPSSDGAAA